MRRPAHAVIPVVADEDSREGSRIGEREPVRVFTDEVHERAVVRAWSSLGEGKKLPARVELLRRRNKSVVYRIPGVGIDGTDVIAKKCWIASAQVERNVYERLAGREAELLHYYGCVEDADGECGWVFVEDADGDPYDPRDEEHRRLGARWLAKLHTSTGDLAAQFPERRSAYYRRHLNKARTAARDARVLLAEDESAQSILRRAKRMADAIEARWELIEHACEALPSALVHNDFTKYNVRVRQNGARSKLRAFDWEISGSGLAMVDVLNADLEEYWYQVRPYWPTVEFSALERALAAAMLLRGLASIHWECLKMHPENAEWQLPNLELYLERMERAQEQLGWRPVG